MKKIFLLTAIIQATCSLSIFSQACFDAGTGVDGAYNASSNTTIVGATYNFTSFNIDAGVTVSVTGTQPLIIYCTGNLTINGTLSANGGNGTDGITYVSAGIGGVGVAGGGDGGAGSYSSSTGPLDGVDGIGTGGSNNRGMGWSGGGGGGYASTGGTSGSASGGFGGPSYGSANIIGFEAGSGGGGGSGGYSCGAGGGGAGGGIIVIYVGSSFNIGASGIISANGGNGGSDGTGNCGGGAGGSGGAIILASPSLTNNGMVTCIGGIGGGSNVPGSPYFGVGANGSEGRIRFDYNGSLNGIGTTNPMVGATNPVNSPPIVIPTTSTDSICDGGQVTLTGSGVGSVSYSWSGGAIDGTPFIPAGSLTYTVTGTAAGGCTNTASIYITVEPLPTIGYSVVNNDSVCPGDSVILNGTGGNFYTWTGSVIDGMGFSPSTSATYTVTGTSIFGCTNTSTADITVLSIPTVDLGADIIQPNPPVMLDAGAGFSSYLWNTAASTQTISVNTNGLYIVTVTNDNGCINSDTVQVNFTASIENPNGTAGTVQLYPIPSNGLMYFDIKNMNAADLCIYVFNMNGQQVYTKYIGSIEGSLVEQLDLTHLSMGTYIFQLNANGKTTNVRFIVGS